MSEALVKVETNVDLSTGGLGLDFGSELFQLKPTTLTINQSNTQADGATPGKLRIVETGEEFDKMTVVLLVTPKKNRSYYLGEKGTLYRTPENLMCFSRDMVRPDERSKQIQAITCASCQFSKWNNDVVPGVPPECDPFYYAIFVDTYTQTPMKMYIRNTSKKPFEAAMQNLARTFKLAQAKGLNPNLFNISFDITTKKTKNKGGFVTYMLDVDGKSFHLMNDEEATAFGEIYLNYINYGTKSEDEVEQGAIDSVNESINSALTPDTQGEITV